MNILEKRKAAGLTQKQLADSLEVDQATVSNWELGKTVPYKKMMPKIAKALGCNVEDLSKEVD